MKVTMDRAGRIVVPKPIRDRLGLDAEAEFDLVLDGIGIRLDPVEGPPREIVEVGGWPTLAPVDGLVITDADVLSRRDADQR